MRRGSAGALRAGLLGLALTLPFVGCARAPQPDPIAQSQNPQGIAPLVDAADRAMQRGDLDAAIRGYRAALDQTPWNSRLRRTLAVAHASRAEQERAAGSLPGADRELRAALALQPGDADLARNLAVVLRERAALELDDARAQAMRAEADQLAPGLPAAAGQTSAAVERRLDLAFELLEDGRLEIGIARLEELRAAHPERDDVLRLLAQAHVRRGNVLLGARNFDAAAAAFARAVDAYALCPQASCERAEIEVAHHNRIVALLDGARTRDARAALDQADAAGLSFPELRAALPAVDFD